jgi:hypothetical protein
MGLALVKAVRERAAGGSEALENGVVRAPFEMKPMCVGETSAELGAPVILAEREAEVRELNYSHAGGYTRQWVRAGLSARLEEVGCAISFRLQPTVEELLGQNTFIEVGPAATSNLIEVLRQALESNVSGTRVTAVVRPQEAVALRDMGFSYLPCRLEFGGVDALEAQGLVAMYAGRRLWAEREFRLDHSKVREYMDPRDRGGYEYPAEQKQAAAWREMPWVPEMWEGAGLPPFWQQGMQDGFEVDLVHEQGASEVPQYPWPSGAALMECVAETDRAVHVGAMEFVPDDEVKLVRAEHIVHPWTIAMKPKPRACQDYSAGTNLATRKKPFELPTVWDAAKVVGPNSHFCAYDLRDGFWMTPVKVEHRNRLVMRHPATGRLIRCARFPFGYAQSPFVFCGLTEAIGQILRSRLAGKGVHVFCYVDDFLLVGEDEAAARLAAVEFEKLLGELGIEWAPHKQRGPCRCINFLGMCLCNAPGKQVVALTEARQERLRGMISSWERKSPGRDGQRVYANPKELASLLGHLVFASQCVPGGRTYMQSMLSQFAGLEVDWRRGAVRWTKGGTWSQVEISDGFWRDLDWWSEHLEKRNCMPMKREQRGEALLAGTDASDWGTGQLVWLDGQREEVVLKFTAAEKKRSINWRELLGISRIITTWGERLKGCTLLIETDNMAAKGAACKGASSSEDMQELLRRMFESAERHDLVLRFVHCPGVLLNRPDQTSRGDPVEEPRVRLRAREFELLEERFGPFSEVLGCERRLISKRASENQSPKLYLHPAHTTVGSALRRLGQRLADTDGTNASGVIVVPHDDAAGWWTLTRLFDVVGRWPAGSSHLEMNQLGEWKVIESARPSLILAFPRGAGGLVSPLRRELRDVSRPGRVDWEHKPMPEGSFFYQVPEKPGGRGVLYVVWKPFNHKDSKTFWDDDGAPLIHGAELLRESKKIAKKDGSEFYALDRRIHQHAGSFAPGGIAWQVNSNLCWAVDNLVTIEGANNRLTVGSDRVNVKAGKAPLETLTFVFNVRRAEQEIAAVKRKWLTEASVERNLVSAIIPTPTEPGPLRRSLRGKESVEVQLESGDFERELRRAQRAENLGSGSQEVSEGPRAGGRLITPAPNVHPPLPVEPAVQELALQLQQQSLGPTVSEELVAAREAAELAASLRKKVPERADPLPKAIQQGKTDPGAPQPCRYSNMVCAGCQGPIHWGEMMVPAGRAMAHAEGTCRSVAEELLLRDVAESRQAKSAASVDGAGSLKRATLFAHRMSDDRIDRVQKCLAGQCRETEESRTFCVRGCGRGLHLLTCCAMTSGRKSLGLLICSECRCEEMLGVGCSPPAVAQRSAAKAMIVELSSGAASTAKGFSEFVRLEKEWQVSVVDGELRAEDVQLPHTNIEAFYQFTVWLSTDGARARSLGTIMRSAGAYMVKLEYVDFTKSGRIKNLIKELSLSSGVVSTPCTHVTRMIIGIMFASTLPKRCSAGLVGSKATNPKAVQMARYMLAKARFTVDLETVGGCRIGETTGAKHGVEANNVVIQRITEPARAEPWQVELGETVEIFLEDTKTGGDKGGSRYITFVGTTKVSKMTVAADLRELWKVQGIHVSHHKELGFDVERPDYWVTRVSLIDMSDEIFGKFIRDIKLDSPEPVARFANYSVTTAKKRRKATSLGEEEKFVNISGGRAKGPENCAAMTWMMAKGWSRFVEEVKGPLIRAPSGYTITHMPLVTTSADHHIRTALDDAYAELIESGAHDPELDVPPGEEPEWGQHSFRREADRVAQSTREKSKVSDDDIDFFFGWNLKELLARMQVHYKGLDRMARLGLAKVTAWF